MTSHRCDDVVLQVRDVTSAITSQQLRASSMTSVYDNVMLDEMTQLSTATSISLDHLAGRCDDRTSCRRHESFTVADSRQDPRTTDTKHREDDDCDYNSTVCGFHK